MPNEEPTELECIVAGVISTYPPFDTQHPETCIPMARSVLGAMRGHTRSFDLLSLDAIRKADGAARYNLVNNLCDVIEQYREMR